MKPLCLVSKMHKGLNTVTELKDFKFLKESKGNLILEGKGRQFGKLILFHAES